MGLLTEPALDSLVAAGCTACRSRKLGFRAFLDGRVPLLAGEPAGGVSWVYDGEKFVDGVYQVACGDCKHVLFSSDLCPRCHAPGGLQRALDAKNRWPVPAACPRCDGEEVRYV